MRGISGFLLAIAGLLAVVCLAQPPGIVPEDNSPAARQATADTLQAFVDSSATLKAFGVKVLADEKDAVWVQLDLPYTKATEAKQDSITQMLKALKAEGAQDVTMGRVRCNRRVAREAIAWWKTWVK